MLPLAACARLRALECCEQAAGDICRCRLSRHLQLCTDLRRGYRSEARRGDEMPPNLSVRKHSRARTPNLVCASFARRTIC